MHTSNKNPTGVELSSILEELIKANITFILVGGLAAVVQGAPVTTLDVDIVYDRSSENISKLLAFLKSIDAFYRRPDDKVIRYEDLIKHTVEIEFRGHTLHVLDLKMLIELKRNSTDPKDKQRLPVLEETLRQLGKS